MAKIKLARQPGKSQLIDISGQRFGRLIVQFRDFSPQEGRKRVRWICRCDCGSELSVETYCLRSGHTQSCGCFNKEAASRANTTHGASSRKLPEYTIWKLMRARCNNHNSPQYKDYGGRGITVCNRWDDFSAFLADMGPRPSPQHSLDRWPDTNGSYSPDNCRWATRKEQARNTRRNVHVVLDGETYVAADAANIAGIKPSSVHWRLKQGHCLEKAFSKIDLRTKAARNGSF